MRQSRNRTARSVWKCVQLAPAFQPPAAMLRLQPGPSNFISQPNSQGAVAVGSSAVLGITLLVTQNDRLMSFVVPNPVRRLILDSSSSHVIHQTVRNRCAVRDDVVIPTDELVLRLVRYVGSYRQILRREVSQRWWISAGLFVVILYRSNDRLPRLGLCSEFARPVEQSCRTRKRRTHTATISRNNFRFLRLIAFVSRITGGLSMMLNQ